MACFMFWLPSIWDLGAHLLETEPALPALKQRSLPLDDEEKSRVRYILYTDNEQFKRKLRSSIYNSIKKNVFIDWKDLILLRYQ